MPTGPLASSSTVPARTSRRTRRATATAVLLALLIAPLTALGLASPAAAASVRDFTQVFSANTNGDVLIAANTLMTCSTTVGATAGSCADARDATSGTTNRNNNQFTAEFVDVDGDASTFNSSTAHLDLPANATVLFAALVWGGRIRDTTDPTWANTALRDRVKVKVGTGGYQPLTASVLDTGSDGSYQGYANVTSLVAAGGEADYTLADVQSTTGRTDNYAGWALVVAVSDPLAPARNLTVFTGFGSVANGNGMPTFTVSGFLTPPSGQVRTTMGAVTYEGDMGSTGDAFRLNSTNLSDALNPADNPFNSSISRNGVATTGRTPSYNNQLGFDADMFDATRILPNGATSADLTLTTGGETFYPGVVTFATELYDPKLLGTKSVSDLNGGSVERGDVLRYTVPVQNIGLDTAADARFFDAIPTGTRYVPGSLRVDGNLLTDDAGDADTGHYDGSENGHVVAYLGAGATSTRGGSVPVKTGTDPQHTVQFDVVVDSSATNGQMVVNSAAMTYRGATTGAAASSASNVLFTPVTAPANAQPSTPPVAGSHVVVFTPTSAQPSLDIDVLANDSDPDLDPLTIVALTDAAGGTAAIVPGPQRVRYTPRADFAGRDVFTYTISDPSGYRATASVQVEVLNTPPAPGDDTASTPGATAVEIALLGNDSDANGDAISIRSAGPASTNGGTVEVLDGAAVRFTPRTGFTGTDTFDYVLQDARGGATTATVTVTVTNNAPVAVADAYTVNTGTSRPLAVLTNDTDRDGHPLTAQLVTGPAHGSVVLNANGTGTYTPTAGYRGADSFTYRASDGTASSAPVTVSLTVNGAPTVVADTATVVVGATSVDVDVLTNDTDAEGGTLTVTVTGAPANGTTAVLADGSVRYTPTPGWAGTDRFTYRATDAGGLSGTADVEVTVANTPPVAVDDTATTATDTPASRVAVLANDTDVNVTAGVSGQSLRVVRASADRGTVDVETDGTLTVRPPLGYAGTVRVTYTVGDGVGGEDEGELVVTVANGAPSAVADGPVSTPTGTSVLVDVLANDHDPNTADVLTLGTLGTPQDADGTVRGAVAVESGQIRYTPPAGWAGTVTFTYDVTDGDVTVTGTVTVVVANAAPVAVDDRAGTPSGTRVTVDVLRNDTDANVPGTAQALTVTGATVTSGSGTVVLEADGRLTVTPAAGFAGDVVVGYTVSDGAGGSDAGTLTVTVANAAPVAPPAQATTAYGTPVEVDLLAGATDANGDALTVTLGAPVDAQGVRRGTVSMAGGVLRYAPPAGFSGTVTVPYTLDDGTDTTTGTVTLVVGNAAPVTTADGSTGTRATTSRGSAVTIDVLADVTDPDGGALTIVEVTQPASGTVTIVDGRLVYTPAPGWSGTATFTYTVVDDQGARTTGTVTVEVLAGSVALATTGADVARSVFAALVLLLVGGALVAVRRRRTVVAG